MSPLPSVYYGRVSQADTERWRSRQDDFDDQDDDEQLEETPSSVRAMLGFDPLEFDEDRNRQRGWDTDDPGVKEHNVHGLVCVVETPKGHVRGGKGWSQKMPADYGYIEGFTGADGDSLDCYVGPDPSSDWCYVVDQRHLDAKDGFDEHKVMLGFNSLTDARKAYFAGHHRASDVFMDLTPMQIKDFKYWLATANLKRPCGEVRG